jgi:hypothetical protein
MDALAKSIDRTLQWFALFSYPLTDFEIWKWLYAPGVRASCAEVRSALKDETLQARVSFLDGFYAPAGKAEAFVATRGERHANAIGKWRQLRAAARAWKYVPGVRAVAAANTLAWWNTRAESDLDVFVITAEGAVWSARSLLVTPYAILGARPGGRRADRGAFDFSFFLSESDLNLSRFALPGDDPYLAYWTASLVPLHDPDGLFPRLWKENPWVSEKLPNAFPWDSQPATLRSLRLRPPRAFERLSRRMQERRFPSAIRERLNRDTCVVADDRALKFHVNDRREAYRDAWKDATRYEP